MITHVRDGDGWVHQVHIREKDFALQDHRVARELESLMLLPRDMDDWMSRSLNEVVNGIYLAVVVVSASPQSLAECIYTKQLT